MLNSVVLHGRLVSDPELRYTPSKVAVVGFTLAVNQKFRSKGSDELKEEVTFVDCEAWDSGAETISKYFKKGKPMLVQGSLRQDKWEKDGQKFSKLKVRVETFDFVDAGPAKDGDKTESKKEPKKETVPAGAGGGENDGTDIPF